MIIVKTIALGNVKAADLESIAKEFTSQLEVTLKGFKFLITATPGAASGFVVQESVEAGKLLKGCYPFSAISDLKDYVRTCVAASQEEAVETPKPKCPSVSDLAYQVTESGNLFFTKKTMKFFGDTLGNYGTRMVQQQDGSWVIELFRRKPVKHNTSSSAYFDAVTFKRLHSVTLKDGQ